MHITEILSIGQEDINSMLYALEFLLYALEFSEKSTEVQSKQIKHHKIKELVFNFWIFSHSTF